MTKLSEDWVCDVYIYSLLLLVFRPIPPAGGDGARGSKLFADINL